MTSIAELRKDPRPTATTSDDPAPIRQLRSTHISSYLLKILGLKPETGTAAS